jgi:nicotinate (nicotinamide) nucleotide adenylyltransferase
MPSTLNKSPINAIFGGTFDPPHIGHILPLQETADILSLTEVSLMPANIPALKTNITSGHHRVAMTRLLCAEDPRFKINLTEFSRKSVSYTVDTLKHMKKAKPDQVIVFIVGLDSLLSLHKWYEWDQLFKYCHLVVMLRPPLGNEHTNKPFVKTDAKEVALNLYDFCTSEREFDNIVGTEMDEKTRLLLLSKLVTSEKQTQSINYSAFKDILGNSNEGKLWFVKNHVLPVSSSEIRRRIKAGKTLKNLVPQSIADYINKHQLYKN